LKGLAIGDPLMDSRLSFCRGLRSFFMAGVSGSWALNRKGCEGMVGFAGGGGLDEDTVGSYDTVEKCLVCYESKS
jgi:hypothetical protein